MQSRWALAPIAAQVRGDAGNRRLHHPWVKFIAHKKRGTIATVAVARELTGLCWSLATLDGTPWSNQQIFLVDPRSG